jgi:hypothetical protein
MTTPKLGFGTAPILGRIGRRESIAALERAYALGVRHFDTARSYGWGEAEGVLGGFLQGKSRHECTIVSKCGIVPVKRSRVLSAAKAFARQVRDRAPGSGWMVQRAASSSRFQPTRTYDVRTLNESVETSLRELRTDYLDVLLLHNFDPTIPGLDDVATWFQRLRQRGSITRYGFSVDGDLIEGLTCLRGRGVLEGAVVQVPVSNALLSLLPEWRDVSLFAHSTFRFSAQSAISFAEILARLGASSRCEAAVCSMFSRYHIEANVAAARAAALADARRHAGASEGQIPLMCGVSKCAE